MYTYDTKPRHLNGTPALGDFDAPQYLGSADYGMPWLAAIPAWAWLTTAAAGVGTYIYGKSEGASETATAAAATQAAGAPPVYQPVYQPQPQYQPQYQPPAADENKGKKLTDQSWFWPAVMLAAGVGIFLVLKPRKAAST